MKNVNIYLTTSTQGLFLMPDIFKDISRYLKKNNCKNLNTFIDNVLEAESKNDYLTPKEDDQLFTKSLKIIGKANFLIADVTYASITVGRQIEYALQKGIPVLCIIDTDKATYISPSMFDTEIELQTFRSYSQSTLNIVLSEYINNFKEKKVRFNLFITRENENFLNWVSKNKQQSKSEIVREIINNQMSINKEYLRTIK